jgi:hypothetical protein
MSTPFLNQVVLNDTRFILHTVLVVVVVSSIVAVVVVVVGGGGVVCVCVYVWLLR